MIVKNKTASLFFRFLLKKSKFVVLVKNFFFEFYITEFEIGGNVKEVSTEFWRTFFSDGRMPRFMGFRNSGIAG